MRMRELFKLAVAGTLAVSVSAAWAQSGYPNRTITMVVPFAAGGGGDTVARILAQGLSTRVNQSVVVENRPGASGNIGTASVLRSKPDGYTLLNISATYSIQTALGKPGFDGLNDMQPIVMATRDPVILLVAANAPWKDMRELTAAAKAKAGAISYGTAGGGSIAHLASEELAFNMGVQMLHVPYKGSSQAYSDILSGNLNMMMTSTAFAVSQIKGGKARALAVVGTTRRPSLPDVPTFAEAGLPNYAVYDWKAVIGPKGIPADVVALLNRELNAVMRSTAGLEKLEGDGAQVVGGTPESLMQAIRDDVGRWRNLAVKTNLKVAD